MILAIYIVVCAVLIQADVTEAERKLDVVRSICRNYIRHHLNYKFAPNDTRITLPFKDALKDAYNKLEKSGVIPMGTNMTNGLEYLRENRCVNSSTYFNEECLFLKMYEFSSESNPDYDRFFHGKYQDSGNELYLKIWLSHPVLYRSCKSHEIKGSVRVKPDIARKSLINTMSTKNAASLTFAKIFTKTKNYTSKLRTEIDEFCDTAKQINDFNGFCTDLLEVARLAAAFHIVKDEDKASVKWDAYQLHFAILRLTNTEENNYIMSSKKAYELVEKNLHNIFGYINKRKIGELGDLAPVLPQKSLRLNCILPGSDKKVCMLFKGISQIRAYFQSKIPLANGQVNKILNTNIDYQKFLGLTEMNEILSLVQHQSNALTKLSKWVTQEIKKDTRQRFFSLRTYFQNVESFNREKSKADISFINGRLKDYKRDVERLSEDMSKRIAQLIHLSSITVDMEIAQKAIKLAFTMARLANPIGKIFGDSSVSDALKHASELAHALTGLAGLKAVKKSFDEIKIRTSNIARKFAKNDKFLGNLNSLINSINKEVSTSDFDEKREKFLTNYTSYNPGVKRPELTAMTTVYENLIDACCEVILSSTAKFAAIPKGVVKEKGLCPKAKEVSAEMFETFAEIYDFQFELVEAMATYMRATNAHYAAAAIGADYDRLSAQDQNPNIVNEFENLTLFAFISYKLNIWGISQAYCDILTYKEGGITPRVCQTEEKDIARLTSYMSPTCRNTEAYKDVPITSTQDQGFMNLPDLYAGKEVTFKIPNSQWLVSNGWISSEDRDAAILVKKFQVFLPTKSKIQRTVRVKAKVIGDNKFSVSQKTSYTIIPKKELIFEYLEGNEPCMQENNALTNPYGASLPKLCPLNVGENNCQELLRKTHLFPSVYSRWKVSLSGYESAAAPITADPDQFRLKVGMKLCIYSQRRNDKQKDKDKKEDQPDEKKKYKGDVTKKCPRPQYWSIKEGKCVKCPEGSVTPQLDGYFCVKIPKKSD